MEINTTSNKMTITYTTNELEFIKTLDEKCQKSIFRGFCTPYDYGYKSDMCDTVNDTVITEIDGQKTVCNLLSHDEFIKLFYELETLIRSDDKKYWILYEEENGFPWSIGEYKEIFWCIPTSQIDFIRNEEGSGWHIASGVGVVNR